MLAHSISMSSNPDKLLRALYVANKYLPDNDYRVIYPRQSAVCLVTYALPRIPYGVDERYFTKVGFGEGVRIANLLHFLELFIYLVRNQKRLDFVHFYSTLLILLGPIVAWLAGLPSLITVTGLGRTFTSPQWKYRWLRPLYRALMGLAIRLSRAVLFQNHSDLSTFTERFPKGKHKYYYVGSAVDLPIVHQKSFSAVRLRVLLAARLLPYKGIQDFLEVADRLKETYEFVLVGPPSIGFDRLFAKVQDYTLRGIIIYTGELDTLATQAQLEKSHIFFFPSYYGEGIARVLLEAGFTCLCPIAYDISSNQDLIKDGCGFLVPCRDTEQVIYILSKLSNDRSCLERSARAYQAYITKNFNITIYSNRMDNLITKLFQKKGGYDGAG